MNLNEQTTEYLCSLDTETHRVCGTCRNLLPVSEFYKDGLNSDGKIRYRRDCKACYKKTRVVEARMKGRKHNG